MHGVENMSQHHGAILDSLPRVGSTSLARALNVHADINVFIEPFHPRRYRGQFNRDARARGSVAHALEFLWERHSVIKHVWEQDAWPFQAMPALNAEVVLASARIVSLSRKNLLQRYVSNVLSRKLDFWIGTKQEFISRLGRVTFEELDPSRVLAKLKGDAAAIANRERLIAESGHPVLFLKYEDLFSPSASTAEQFNILNQVIEFLGFRPLTEAEYVTSAAVFLAPEVYRWADEDVYHHLPNARELDGELSSYGYGRLF